MKFIEDQFRKFFMGFSSISPFLPCVDDKEQFYRMREKQLEQPTTRQSQIAMDVDSASIVTDQTNGQHNKPEEIN